jgi:Zn-finger nucleic acid-binding protein
MEMKCPVDGGPLEKFDVDSIEVEKCPECQGLWIAKHEMRQAEEIEGVDEDWMGFDLWSDQGVFEAEKSSRKCPVCDQNMATIRYGQTGVKVEYCVDKHGIWLDQGEFESIIDSLREELLTKSLPEYVSLSLDEAKEIFTGDKGPIHEWKDFKSVYRLMEYRILVDNPRLKGILIGLGRSSFSA